MTDITEKLGMALNEVSRQEQTGQAKKIKTMTANIRSNMAERAGIVQASKTGLDGMQVLVSKLQDLGQTAHARKIMELMKQAEKVAAVVIRKYE